MGINTEIRKIIHASKQINGKEFASMLVEEVEEYIECHRGVLNKLGIGRRIIFRGRGRRNWS